MVNLTLMRQVMVPTNCAWDGEDRSKTASRLSDTKITVDCGVMEKK